MWITSFRGASLTTIRWATLCWRRRMQTERRLINWLPPPSAGSGRRATKNTPVPYRTSHKKLDCLGSPRLCTSWLSGSMRESNLGAEFISRDSPTPSHRSLCGLRRSVARTLPDRLGLLYADIDRQSAWHLVTFNPPRCAVRRLGAQFGRLMEFACDSRTRSAFLPRGFVSTANDSGRVHNECRRAR